MFRGRLSARALVTIAATALTAAMIFLITAVVSESLTEAQAGVARDATAAIWTVGLLLIVLAGTVAWFFSGYLLQPLAELRSSLRLSARSRAVLESQAGEMAEIVALRNTLGSVLSEIEGGARAAELEKRRLLNVFESAHEGILHVTADGRFVHVNAAGRNLLRLPHHPEGQMVDSLVRQADLRTAILSAAGGSAAHALEFTSDERQLLVACEPLMNADGDSAGAIVTVVDLTDLRRLESVRRDFVANVSHELKTPLTSIRGYAETLLSDELPVDVQKQFLQVIAHNAERLQRIVEELLDLSRLESGGWHPELVALDACALAGEAWLSAFDEVARQKQIGFLSCDQEAYVLADPDGLRQVFSNLFDNALRYTPGAGSICVQARPVGRMLDIQVKDSGVGIPRDALPRVFERFYRVDPARSRAEGGTGLGLSIVKHLVERMNGEVFAESELGKGTTIHIVLPRPIDE